MQDLMRNLLLGGGGGFSPQSLFTGGVEGALYDPSDLSTLYQDSAGSTPVTGVEQVVGLMLDKSKNLALGPELVTNGDFSSGTTGWEAVNGTLSEVSGRLRVSYVTSNPFARQGVTCVVGKTYVLTGQYFGGTETTRLYIADSNTGTNPQGLIDFTGDGAATVRFHATATTMWVIATGRGLTTGEFVEFDNISVRELPGNHATSTGSARPTLSARVNLLTYSEEFDNGAWSKTGLNTTGTPPWVNVAVAPDGTTTADKLLPNAGSVVPYVYQTITTSAISYTVSFYSKADGYNFVQLSDSVSATDYCNFNLSGAGSVGNSVGYTGSIQDVGNGWFHCVATKTFTAASTEIRIEPLTSDLAARRPSIVADGTSAILIWGADLRPANIGVNIPPYQRIAAATNYDTNGFPFYLSFGGAQSMSTPANLDLTGTDKVTVFAGVRKLSDVAAGVIAELSASFGLNSGTFLVMAADSAGANYYFGINGTGVGRYRPTTYTSPISNVLAASYDIGGAALADEIKPRINGVLNQSNPSGIGGTGNFGTYPLYIGARAGSSFFFNGYLYSLIIQGTTASATQLASTEAWVNQKTKAY